MKTSVIDGVVCAIAQMRVKPGQLAGNTSWIIGEIAKAEKAGVDIIIFPEACVSGYLLGDEFENDAFVYDIAHHNELVIAATAGKNIVAIFGTILTDGKKGEDGRLRKINGGYVVRDGKKLLDRKGAAFFAKTNLPKYRMFQEVRHMTTSQILAAEQGVTIEDYLQPFDLPIRGRVVRVGVIDCEDGWTRDYLIKVPHILAAHGIDLFANVSSSPWGWQKNRARHEQFGEYLAELGIPMIYANIVGAQDNAKAIYPFDGATTVYNHKGEVAVSARPFAEEVIHVTLSGDMPKALLSDENDQEQLWRGYETGYRHALETIPLHLRHQVIGLSGGVDSAVVAATGAYILGPENVTGMNLPMEGFNKAESIALADFSAHALGINYHSVPITQHVNLRLAEHGLTLDSPGIDNIMAVERMVTLSARRNAVGGFFTCNGNKSEAGFGYYSKEGDGSGAFAPLGDCYKGDVRQLGYYLNTVVFGKEVVPWALITGEVAATAELAKEVRKDPFDYGYVTREGELIRGYHDQMLHAFVGFRKDPQWFLEQYMSGKLEADLLLKPGKVASLFDTPAAFIADVERCWNSFRTSVWKRHQLPTVIAVSKRPFGFDYQESLLGPQYTTRYHELKSELLRM